MTQGYQVEFRGAERSAAERARDFLLQQEGCIRAGVKNPPHAAGEFTAYAIFAGSVEGVEGVRPVTLVGEDERRAAALASR